MTPIRLLLNSGFSGANAFLAIALQQGLFRDAQLDLRCTPGRGAYTAAQRLVPEGFDAAYGDLNALIELAATEPAQDLPVAVLLVHPRAPSTITVARDGPVRGAADLAGRSVVGHASDVALRTFPVYARTAGLAPGAVALRTSDAVMAKLLADMLQGASDGVFGYMTTHTAALAGIGRDAATCVRFLPYRDVCPDLMGSALMVAPPLARDQPQVVAALVRVVLAGIELARTYPAAALDAVIACNPAADRAIEGERWRGTLHGDMAEAPGGHGLGGGVDEARLSRAIASMALAFGWAQAPAAARVFTPAFLPRERAA